MLRSPSNSPTATEYPEDTAELIFLGGRSKERAKGEEEGDSETTQSKPCIVLMRKLKP